MDTARTLRVLDREFRPYLSAAELHTIVCQVAQRITHDLKADFDARGAVPLVVPVLNGAFIFAADLVRELSALDFDCEVCCVKSASYSGTTSTGTVHDLIGFPGDISNRDVILVEDVIETGLSIGHSLQQLRHIGVRSVRVCCLFHKPSLFREHYTIDYVGRNIPNDFILGYGMDYNERGRGLKDLWVATGR